MSTATRAELEEAVDVFAEKVDEQQATIQRLAAALKEIAEWPNGGNRYGQKNIKEFARATLRESGATE